MALLFYVPHAVPAAPGPCPVPSPPVTPSQIAKEKVELDENQSIKKKSIYHMQQKTTWTQLSKPLNDFNPSSVCFQLIPYLAAFAAEEYWPPPETPNTPAVPNPVPTPPATPDSERDERKDKFLYEFVCGYIICKVLNGEQNPSILLSICQRWSVVGHGDTRSRR